MLKLLVKAFYTSRFRKANKHYASRETIGERSFIERDKKDPVEVLLYRPKECKEAPVFVQIHGGAWVGLDAVEDDEVMSPCVAPDKTLRKVANATIIVCGRDPIHPQGEYYANRLKNVGNQVELKMYENGYHSFGPINEEEKQEQDILREECFWYKVEQAKRLYM